MLSNRHFYFKTTRKYVILFGNLFNDITLMKTNSETDAEIERIKVPIIYGPKEKYYTRLRSDVDLERTFQISLPTMSFEMTGINYDASRQQIPPLRTARANNSTRTDAQYMAVPYDLNFELNIYARNIDDGTQIIEQILPFFHPSYTVAVNVIPEIGFTKDIPIILDRTDNSIEHEGNYDSARFVTWKLSFTMKAYYFGPISSPKIIRKVITNIYNDPSLEAGYVVRINTGSGNNGTFKIDDTVFQGNNYLTATAYGTVVGWNANLNKIVIAGAQGSFNLGTTIQALSTNASYNAVSFDVGPLKLAEIVIEPNPIDAEPESDFGYDIQILEWPDTE